METYIFYWVYNIGCRLIWDGVQRILDNVRLTRPFTGFLCSFAERMCSITFCLHLVALAPKNGLEAITITLVSNYLRVTRKLREYGLRFQVKAFLDIFIILLKLHSYSMSERVRVTRNYQVTIPASIRRKAGIKEGDYLVVYLSEEGHIVMEKVRRKRKTLRSGRKLTMDEIDELIEKGMKESFRPGEEDS